MPVNRIGFIGELFQLSRNYLKMNDFQKQVLRELKDLRNQLTLIYEEREILEDIIGSIKAFSEKLTFHRGHIDNIVDDVKGDVKESQLSVEEKMEEVKKEVKQGNNITEELKEAITK